MTIFSKTSKRKTGSTFRKTEGKITDEELQQKNTEAATAVQQYDQKIASGGYMSSEDLYGYQEAKRTYIDTGNAIRKRLTTKGYSFTDEQENDWTSYVAGLNGRYDQVYAFYSQYEDEDAYIKGAAGNWQQRQQRYEDNKTRIEELKAQRAQMAPTATYNPDSNTFLPVFDPAWGKVKQIDDEIAALEAENAQYKRGEGGWVSKEVDDNYQVTQRTDFADVSAKREYTNPSLDVYAQAPAYNDRNKWYYDENGVYRDAYGNALETDEYGNWIDPRNKDVVIEDKLGLFLGATEDQRNQAAAGNWGINNVSAVFREGLDGDWKYLQDWEIDVYYYYLAESQERAYQYLTNMERELDRRRSLDEQGKWLAKYDQATGFERFLMNAETIPANVVGGFGAFVSDTAAVLRGDEVNPYSTAHSLSNYTRTVRGATANDLNDIGFLGDFFTLGDLYQSGMSMADSLLAMGIGGQFGGVLLAMSAAESEATRLYQQGASAEKIAIGAAVAGAAELIFESLSLGNLEKIKNMPSPESLGQFFKTILVQGGVEASEEMLTEIANTVADAFLMGSQSGWDALVQESDGNWGKALLNKTLEVLHAGLGGFFSGGGSGMLVGGASAVANRSHTAGTGKAIMGMDGSANALIKLAGDLGIDTSKIDVNKPGQVGRLFRRVHEAVSQKSQQELVANLVEKGVSEKAANQLAKVIIRSWMGAEVTEMEADLMAEASKDPNISAAVAEVLKDRDSVTRQRYEQLLEISHGTVKKTNSVTAGIQEETSAAPAAQETQAQDMEGKTFLKSSGKEVGGISVKAIGKDGVTVTVNGDTDVQLEDVSFPSEAAGVAYAVVTQQPNMTPSAANAILRNTKANNMDFVNEAVQAFQGGVRNDANVAQKLDADVITAAEARALFKEGRRAAQKTAEEKQAARVSAAKNQAAEKKGGVFFGYDGKTIDQRNDGRHKPLTKKQQVVVDLTKRLAKKFGSTVYFYESYKDAEGNLVYKAQDGEVREARNGFYDPKDGSIHVDLNGENLLFTLSHEMVHFIRDWSPMQFKKMADLVMKGFNRQGLSAQELIESKQAEYAEAGIELTEEEAFEEVIAAALEGIMADGRVLELLQAAEAKDKRLGAKVRQFFQDIGRMIRDTIRSYQDVAPESAEGRLIRQLEDIYSQLQEAFAEGVMDAGENFRKTENTTGEGGVRYMSRSIEEVTRDTVKQDLTDVFKGNNVTSGSYIPLLKSTPFAVRYITGYKIDRPVIVDKKKSYFDMRENGRFKEDRSHHYHGMGIDGFIDALSILDDPEFAIQEKMDDGNFHYAFISTNENGEEICIVFQMNVSKSPSQMNGYAGGYYNLDITEFVATDEWLEEHGADPGMSYKDFLLSFPENSIVYDRSIHFEQLEKARNIDSGSAGLAASHINNRASRDRVAQPEKVVKKISTTDSDGNQQSTNRNPRESPDIRYSIGRKTDKAAQEMVEKENAKLREDVARLTELLKLQGTQTHGTKFTPSSVEAAARYLKKSAGAKGDTKTLAKLLNGFYEYIATEKELTWEGVREQARPIANWLMDHREHTRSDYAQEVLDQIRGSRIRLDDSQKAEAAHRFGSFDAFRKMLMGSVIITNDANTSLDSWWQEMASAYPDVFDAQINAGNMPVALGEIIDRLRNENTSALEYAHNRRWIEQDLIRDVYDSYWRVNNLRTVADRNAVQINRLKSEHAQRINKLKADNRQKVEQLKEQHRAEVEVIRTAYHDNMEKQRKELAAQYQDSRKQAVAKVRETAEKQDARKKLQKMVIDTAKWLSHPAKTDVKCPDVLKKPYAEFLNSIDMSSQRLSKGGDPTKNDLRLANAMNNLATSLEKIVAGQDPGQETADVLDCGYLDLPADFVKQLRDTATQITEMMTGGDYVVNSMTAADVRQLSQMIRTLNHAIKTMSKLYANMRFSSIEALGVDTMEFLDALGENETSGGVKDFVQWVNALPYYAFKRFGTGGESIFEGLMNGLDKLAFHAKQLFAFQEKTWTAKEAKEWSEDVHTIQLPSGGQLKLTTADAMSIYCLSRRPHGLQHLLGGGTRVMGLQKGAKKANDSRSRLTIEDVDAINNSLTKRQKEVAAAIQQFMSTVCAQWANEISMKRFLTKDFTEEYYFPIESNDENMTMRDPAKQQSDLFRLLNISATKPITPKANNEVIIRNIFDVFSGHASDMAKLNAFGMPLLDYMKWLNYREKTVNDAGQIDVTGVRKSMQTAYGEAAGKYVLNLIKDVNGKPSDGGLPGFYKKMQQNAKTAMVGNNLRVATLQVTSYPRAALVLSPKNLALGLSKKPNIKRAQKYCGIALWKSFGFYETDIARTIEEQIKGTKDIRQKLIELSLKGAELGDAITWGALWNACEYEVAATKAHKVGTEEFYQAVGSKLREVVYRTQVVDSVLTRSEAMRSKNAKMKELSAFMSEPTLSANILMDAGFTFAMEKRRTGSGRAAWKKTGAYVARAFAVYSVSQLGAALVEALWDTVRSDDDEEEKWNIYLKALGKNLALDMLPFNKIPIVSEFAEAAMSLLGLGYYATDSIASTGLSQTLSALTAWAKFFNGKATDDPSVYKAIYKTMQAVSSLSGVAGANAMRDLVALWNSIVGAIDEDLIIK